MSPITVKFCSILAAFALFAPIAWAHLQSAAQMIA